MDAINILLNNPTTQTVNVYFLYGFSTINLFIDIICSSIVYYRRKTIFYRSDLTNCLFLQSDDDSNMNKNQISITSSPQQSIENLQQYVDVNSNNSNENYNILLQNITDIPHPNESTSININNLSLPNQLSLTINNNNTKNLNMISASTHVGKLVYTLGYIYI